jgi:dTDP-glucose 4,6-dehydratase
MKYLIIGGAGVFAMHLIKDLQKLKSTSLIISVGRSPEREEAFTYLINKKKTNYIYRQIHFTFENDKLIRLIERYEPNYIINFAALAHASSWNDSFRYYDTNITAVSKLTEFLYNKKYLKQFLQIGSSEIYGATKKPATEQNIPNPTSPYAVSKLAADYHLLSCYNYNNFPCNIIRPSNCYGPGQLMYRLIPKAILCAIFNKKFPLEGGGNSQKSFMHANDLSKAIIYILRSNKYGEIYNAGSDHPLLMKDIVKVIAEKFDINYKNFIEVTSPRRGEDKIYWINSNKIKKEFGWKTEIDLDQGIEDCINWVLKYKDVLKNESTEFYLRA